MAEALGEVIDRTFTLTGRRELRWECVVGNRASLRVAQRTGFRFTGTKQGRIATRDGSSRDSWTGVLRFDEDRDVKHGWPE